MFAISFLSLSSWALQLRQSHPLILVLGPGVSVSTHYLSWWSCCAWVTFSELLLPSLAPKKVREARFLSSKVIFVYLRVVLCFGFLNGILIMCRWLAGSLDVTLCGFFCLACMEQWGRTGILAQASSSRLGENIRGLPKVLPRALAQAAHSHFQQHPVSLRRDGLA